MMLLLFLAYDSLPGGTNAGWHQIFTADSNSDTYLYLCNGAQPSSGSSLVCLLGRHICVVRLHLDLIKCGFNQMVIQVAV